MKKSPVHRSTVQSPERASERVRQDSFASEFSGDLFEASSDFSKRLVPANALPRLCAAAALARGLRPFRSQSPHGIQNPVRRINAVQVLGHFGTEESTCNRMRRITLDLCRAPIFHSDQNSTSIRAIMRTGGVDYILHDILIIECVALLRNSAASAASAF